ncbi:MAG: sigma-70 family RNA polymerase sigma factor [Candidatus Hydrogenedentes bacterium]|nr:sigma-70 family RNA polymerase sigma factor [Candidatus Hydrogenedentota bacterium]
MAPSDAQLLRSWRFRREAEAYHALIQRYAGMVYATCLRILRNRHDAEEVAQDCFVTLAQSPAQVGEYLGPWLHRVATTRSLDRRKSEQRHSAAIARMPRAETVEQPIPLDDLLAQVDAAIAALPEPERMAIVVHFLEGRTQQAHAVELGISQQAVSHRIKKGIDGIRAVLRSKGIPVSTAVLSAALAESAGAAIPSSLSTTLAKLALAGLEAPIATSASISAGITVAKAIIGGIVVKKTIAGVAVLVLIASIAYYLSNRPSSVEHTANETPSKPRVSVPAEPITSERETPAPRARPVPLARSPESAERPALEPGEIAEPGLYASISGTVTNQEGEAVAGARVSVMAPGMDSTGPGFRDSETLNRILGNGRHGTFGESDPKGLFKVEGIRFKGSAFVFVNAEGYWVDNPEIGQVEIQPGVVIEGLDFRLSPGGADYGIVLDPRGIPLPGATVFCEEAGSVHVEEDGSFFVCVPGDQQFLTFYVFHDTYGRATFGDIRRKADQVIELQMKGMATLTGTITTVDAGPAAGYTVRIDDIYVMEGPSKNEIPPHSTTTDANGVYRIDGIEGGAYLAQVLAPGESAVSGLEAIGELKPGQTHTWNHAIAAAMRVHGVVRSETRQQPMANKFVVWAVDGRIVASAQTNERGEYEMEIFNTPGEHIVAPVSTRVPYDDALPEVGLAYGVPVTVGPGSDLNLDLTLPDTFTAAAYFVDERGAPVKTGIRVRASMHDPASGSSAPGEVLHADPSGRYQWDKFQTGLNCNINAWPEDGVAYIFARTPQFDGPANSGTLEFVVQLHRRARIEGRVLDADGSVLRGKSIWCNLELANGESYGPMSTTTGWDGDFTLEENPSSVPSAVPAGSFHMTLYYGDTDRKVWVWKSGELEVGPDQTLDIGDVQLEEFKDE